MSNDETGTRRRFLRGSVVTGATVLTGGTGVGGTSFATVPSDARLGRAVQRSDENTARIGLILPAEASLAAERAAQRRTVEFAVDLWNDVASDGQTTVELTIDEPSVGDAAGTRVISERGGEADILVNATPAATSSDTIDSLRHQQVPQFDVFSVGDRLPENSWTYRIRPDATKQAQDFVRNVTKIFERAGRPIETIGFAHHDGDSERALFEQIVRQGAAVDNPRIEFDPVVQTTFERSEESLRDQATELQDAAPDILCLVTKRPGCTNLLDAFSDVGYHPEYVIATGGSIDYDPAPDREMWSQINGNLLGIGPFSDPTSPRSDEIYESFATYTGTDAPDPESMQVFDPVTFQSVLTASTAISAADSSDGTEVTEILDTNAFDSGILAMQGIDFDTTGENRLATSVTLQIQSLIPRVIYPQAYKETTPNAPLYFIDKEPPVIGGERPNPPGSEDPALRDRR